MKSRILAGMSWDLKATLDKDGKLDSGMNANQSGPLSKVSWFNVAQAWFSWPVAKLWWWRQPELRTVISGLPPASWKRMNW